MANDVQRVHYYNGQFLRESDFTDEQSYHIGAQRDHMRHFHTPGIAAGLTVPGATEGETAITIEAGVAYDDLGRRIVLAEGHTLDLAGLPPDASAYLTIGYAEQTTGESNEAGISGFTRWTEHPQLEVLTEPPAEPKRQLLLARVSRSGTAVAGVDDSERLLASVRNPLVVVSANAITVVRDDEANRITIGESHSTRSDNPHGVSAQQIGALAVQNGVLGNNAITVTTNNGANQVTIGESHSARNDNPHGVSSQQVGALPIAGGTLQGDLQLTGYLGVNADPVHRLFVRAGDESDQHSYGAVVSANTSVDATLTRALQLASSSAGNGRVDGLLVEAAGGGTGAKYGVNSTARGDGPKYAASFNAITDVETSTAVTSGMQSLASTVGSGTVFGARITATHSGTGIAYGLHAATKGSAAGIKYGAFITAAGSGDNRAGRFEARSSADSNDQTYGIQTIATTAGTGTTVGHSITASNTGTAAGNTQGVVANVTSGGSGVAYGSIINAISNGTGSAVGSRVRASVDNDESKASAVGNQVIVQNAGTGTAIGLQAILNGDERGAKYGIRADVRGSGSAAKYGIYSLVDGGTGTKYGIYSAASGEGGTFAAYFAGNVHVTGNLTASSKLFCIDHPLDPLNRTLRHTAVESPEELCLYRGRITLDDQGEATVEMPSYFAALTREEEATVSLTPIGRDPFLASYEWNEQGTAFTIYGNANRDVSYLVLANRDDPTIRAMRQPVEQNKPDHEKGTLLFPAAYPDLGALAAQPVPSDADTPIEAPEDETVESDLPEALGDAAELHDLEAEHERRARQEEEFERVRAARLGG